MNYLKQFEQYLDSIAGIYSNTIQENKEDVGREFQHIEDLVYIYGPQGAKRAIDRLASIAKDSSHLELKWDGSPAIIFGRDNNGNFHFGDKYSKEIVGSGESVYQQYVGRSGQNVSDERRKFAGEMSALYDLYERATPKDFRGFIEGALLYKTRPPINNKNEYVFQPNTVIYHVDKNNNLGKLISKSTSASTATAYFDNLPALGGKRITTNLTNLIQGVGNEQVLILPPKYSVEQAQIPTSAIKKLYDFLNANASLIEDFVTPGPEWIATYPDKNTATKKWREVIYKYVNSQVDVPGGLEKLGSNMAQWAESDPILTKARRPLATEKIKNSSRGLTATFTLVRGIMNVKDVIVDQLETKTLGSANIRAELPGGVSGGEGFVSDPEGGVQPLKFVKRGAFTAANRAKGRVGVKEDNSDNKTAVVGWGRGMGHKGHMYLASSVIEYAKKIGATPFFFVSETVGKDDPLDTKTKLAIYKTVFPQYKNIFHTGKNPIQISQEVFDLGYKNLVFVVGADQKESFQFLSKPTKSTGTLPVPFDSVKVMSRQETNTSSSGMEGPRATGMREALKNSDLSYEEKFKVWRRDMPDKLSDEQVSKIMKQAAKTMGVSLEDTVKEGDLPPQGSLSSPIPGTPKSLQPKPNQEEIEQYHKQMKDIERFLGR